MSAKEKQPYVEKKRQYDEQLQREQQALKRFQKQGNNNSNTIKTRDSSNATKNADKKEEGKNGRDNSNNTSKAAQNLKFVK